MHRSGQPPERVKEAEAVLPDPIDLDREADVLYRFGLTPDQLYNRLGASP